MMTPERVGARRWVRKTDVPVAEAINGRLRRLILAQRSLLSQVLWGAAIAAAAAALKLALPERAASVTPFIFYYPGVAAAGAFLGAVGGVACLAAGIAVYVVQALTGGGPRVLALWPAGLIYVVCSGFILWLTAMLRRLVRDLHQAEQQHAFLLAELQHRVKNTLTVVQAIASQTLRARAPHAHLERALTDRLIALAKAHNLLSEDAWRGAPLRELLAHALEPFLGPHGERMSLRGEELELPADTVVGLALCLHELATNATKYGALSTPDGRVEVTWAAAGGRVSLEWREQGGPAVTPPTRKGFGSRILLKGVTGRARPKLSIDFPPEGLVWRAEFDLAVREA
jgi:two-component sensor histidine kinase